MKKIQFSFSVNAFARQPVSKEVARERSSRPNKASQNAAMPLAKPNGSQAASVSATDPALAQAQIAAAANPWPECKVPTVKLSIEDFVRSHRPHENPLMTAGEFARKHK